MEERGKDKMTLEGDGGAKGDNVTHDLADSIWRKIRDLPFDVSDYGCEDEWKPSADAIALQLPPEDADLDKWATLLDLKRSTIFRVPPHICEKKEHYFQPLVVSIGPLHRGEKHLQPMEERKLRYLHRLLLRRDGDDDEKYCLRQFIQEMQQLEPKIRGCYVDKFPALNSTSDEFVGMLLLDASFILQHVLQRADEQPLPDKLVDVSWFQPQVDNDLLMFENQIPFIVLERLYERVVRTDATNPSLLQLLHKIIPDRKRDPPSDGSNIIHLLHFFYYCSVPEPKRGAAGQCPVAIQEAETKSIPCAERLKEAETKSIPCAERLKEAGVEFKTKDKYADFLDVSFTPKGILQIPPVTIYKSSKSGYFNFVVFEQCIGRQDQYTSYVLFMDCLINSERDVALLQKNHIIDNLLPSEKDAAVFFNELAECAYLTNVQPRLAKLFKEVNEYCSSNWHEYRATLMRDYFSSPWATISLIAGIVLLILTLIQTILAIYSFFYPPSLVLPSCNSPCIRG